MSSTIVATLSGARIDLLAPDWRAIELADVACGLALVRRFNGRGVSVLDHSERVADLVALPRLKLAARLHDAHEFVFGDWLTPALCAVADLVGLQLYGAVDVVKQRLDVAILRRVLATFGPAEFADEESEDSEAKAIAREMRALEVHAADKAAAALELRALDLGRPLGPALGAEAETMRWLEGVRRDCAARYGARP